MILDERKSRAFRKTINGFMPKQLSSKMMFQCLPMPQALSSIRKSNRDIERQVQEQKESVQMIKVTGRELHKSLSYRKRAKSNNNKGRIKTIKLVMQNPEKLVNTLISSTQRKEMQTQLQQLDRVQIKTPQQIITSIKSSMLDSQATTFISKYHHQINSLRQDNMQYYEQMILDNPVLFKKIMLAYNASKRQMQKETNKINIRKVIKQNAEPRTATRPKQLKQLNINPLELKKNICMMQCREFQMAINLSNKQVKVPPSQGLYKAYICKGNNGLLVKNLLKSRPWWSIRGRGQMESCNLIWTQWKRTKTTNHLPNNTPQISQSEDNFTFQFGAKPKMRQLRMLTEKKLSQMKKVVLLQDSSWRYYQKLKGNQSYLILGKKILDSKYDEISTLLSLDKVYKVKKGEKQQKMVNHVPGCLSLHSKKLLFRNLKHYYEVNKRQIFDVIPITYHVTKGIDDPEFANFQSKYEQIAKKYKGKGKGHNIWICKPGQNSNRGNGITVLNSLAEIRSLANQKCSSQRSLIIQKYFQSPFLYNKRKFDIRCFILITTVNGIVKGYWYQDGYIRTSSKQFTLKNLQNKYVHLTNDAIQKKSEEYGKFQNCNKVSYSEFQKYLEANYSDQKYSFDNCLEKMKEIATDLVNSVAIQLNPTRKQYCFQIFGLDFMLDSQFKPYLIEANSNPSITVDGTLLARIVPTMLENVMKVAIDPVFPPPLSDSIKNKYAFSNPFETNKMVLIYDSYYHESKLESNIVDFKDQVEQELPQNQEDLQDVKE